MTQRESIHSLFSSPRTRNRMRSQSNNKFHFRFLMTCDRADAFAKNQHPTVHSTHARRLNPRLHGKPFTLATPSSSSRSWRKLRGTSPFIALSPARRRRVSGARRRRVFFHDASSSRVDVVVTKRRHRACDEEFCACTHAGVRARHLVIAELSLPPRRSISSIVAFSGATSLATRVIVLVEIPRERAPIA